MHAHPERASREWHIACSPVSGRAASSRGGVIRKTSGGTSMITLSRAQSVIDAGMKEAQKIGQPMNIAVVDAGGNLVAHVRMDDAWIGSVDIAINKAFTARAFDVSTKELGEKSQPGGDFFGIQVADGGKVMTFAGGIPLRSGDRIVGAVGVSGGTGKQDQQVAEAAAQGFG
jgi:uncharacterized protein GlcG (DUF336 family)